MEINSFKVKIHRQDWEEKEKAAKRLMSSRGKYNKLLIEVATDHPLKEKEYPSDEFTARLNLGLELYQKEKAKGIKVTVFVPGSLHLDNGKKDLVSLSEAGVKYLQGKGIKEDDLHGEDLIKRYLGDKGCYNTADECFISSSYFKDNDFGHFYSICSPAQSLRKGLNYIWFGVIPQIFTVATSKLHHSYVVEAYENVPYTRDVDPSGQEKDSYFYKISREIRKPKK
jgi:hypothetical protein